MSNLFELRRRSVSEAMESAKSPYVIACKEIDALIVDYRDDALPKTQKAKFESHMRDCSACREYLNAYKNSITIDRHVIAFLDAYLPDDVPENLITVVIDFKKSDQELALS